MTIGGRESDASSALLRFTFPFNTTGQPALSLSCGFSTGSLPIGLQLVGRHLDEPTILHGGHAYQQATALASPAPGNGLMPPDAAVTTPASGGRVPDGATLREVIAMST